MSIKDEYSWNPVYRLMMEIKYRYLDTFNDGETELLKWVEKLNDPKYINIFKNLHVVQHNSNVIITYGILNKDMDIKTNVDSVYRECRGVVIDIANDNLVISPYKKFFNINEVDETRVDNILNKIKNSISIEFSNKLDGFMQCARYYDGEVLMSGKASLDRAESWRLDDGYNKLQINHIDMIKAYPELTFIFENINRDDSIVVKYDKENEGLHLIGIRNTRTGEQFSYAKVSEIASKYNVRMTQIEKLSFDEICTLVKELRSCEKEGWVMNIDGELLKIKCDDYTQVHKIVDPMATVNVLIKMVDEDKTDDLISKLPDNQRYRIEELIDNILSYKMSTEKEVEALFEKAPKHDRKSFMVWIQTNVHTTDIRGYVISKYLNGDYNVLKTGMGNYKRGVDLGIVYNKKDGGENEM